MGEEEEVHPMYDIPSLYGLSKEELEKWNHGWRAYIPTIMLYVYIFVTLFIVMNFLNWLFSQY